MKRGLSRRAVGLVILGLVAGVASASAQQKPATPKPATSAPAAAAPAGGKVAWLDSRQILSQTPGYAAAESTFTKEIETYRVEVGKLQATLDSAAADFDQQSVVLSPTQKTAKRTELQNQQQKLEARTQELQQKAASRRQELLSPIEQRVNSIIEGIRAEGGYALIFDVSAPGTGILAADKALDLTQRVVQRLKSGS